MKKYISLLFAMIMATFTLNAFAFTPPAKPDNGWYIVDQAGKLTDDQKNNLNKKIDNINKTTKNEFGVLILQSLDGDDIEDAAQNTFRSWGVGKAGLNNGILLVISVGDRKMRLQTGKGVEGDLPDLRAKDILDQNLKPFLKKGDFFGGISSTIDTTSSYLESRANKTAASTQPDSNDNASTAENDYSGAWIFFLVLLGLGGVATLIIWLSARSDRKAEEARQKRYEEEREAYRILAEDRERRRIQREKESIALHSKASDLAAAAVIGAGTVAVASTLSRDDEAKKLKRRQEEESRRQEAEIRRRREEEEASARRRREESYSSSSSYSSYDSGSSSYSSSDSSSSDFGGGFSGGDSGGSGASGDW